MATTDDQLRAITYLAVSCRPHGARHWEAPDVFNALARLRHINLADLTQATIHAAADREALPSDLADRKHWHGPPPAQNRPPAEPEHFDRARACGVCTYSKEECRRRYDDSDHLYVPAYVRVQSDAAGHAAAIRATLTGSAAS